MMRPCVRAIEINALAPKVDVDNRISLPSYYRIADNLLKQAIIYGEEKNLIDLYIILLRFSCLLCCHHEFQGLPPAFKKKLLDVMNELKSLKSEVQRQVDEVNREHAFQTAGQKRISYSSVPAKAQIHPSLGIEQVQSPSNFELIQSGSSSLNRDAQSGPIVINEGDSRIINYDLESVLSLDDGRWSVPVEESGCFVTSAVQEDFAHLNIRQPSPPVLAHVQQPELCVIPPSKVADRRPGPAKPSQDETKLVNMMESFPWLAEKNTAKNLETCGILAGPLKNRMFYVTTLIIPKQESTSDSTHPTQTCFMSAIDLHTHYSYQILLPEAIAIVMVPTDTSRTHGIFHLTDPTGVSLISNCQE